MARSHPIAAVAILVAVTMVRFVVAAIVIAGLFAFSGVWLFLALIMFARRYGGGGHGRGRGSGPGRPPYGRSGRGRYQYWIP